MGWMMSTTKWILKSVGLQKNSSILKRKESNLLKTSTSSYKRIHSILKSVEKDMNFIKYTSKMKNKK